MRKAVIAFLMILLFAGQAFGEDTQDTITTDGEQTEIAFAPRRLGERFKRFDAFNQFGTPTATESGGYILQSGTTDKILLSGTTDALMTSH